MTPVWMSHESLMVVLEDITAHVKAGDSYEGSIEYLIPDPEDPQRTADTDTTPISMSEWMGGFMVRASYRIGNLQGQGGMRMIGDMER